MDDIQISQRLKRIEALLIEQNMLKKDVLNFIEATAYLEVSSSHLYKLTSSNVIPFYKPNGKKLYFRRSELDSWLLTNRQTSVAEQESKANLYLMKTGRAKR